MLYLQATPMTEAFFFAALFGAVVCAGFLVAEPVARDWGGYSGYFADPDGFRWEVAFNPGPIGLSVL